MEIEYIWTIFGVLIRTYNQPSRIMFARHDYYVHVEINKTNTVQPLNSFTSLNEDIAILLVIVKLCVCSQLFALYLNHF